MTAAILLLVYATLVTWVSPPLLSRLTCRGVSPRLGVAAWLSAITGALLARAAAVTILVAAGVQGLSNSSAMMFCLKLVGLPAAAPSPLSMAALIVIGLVASAVVTVKVTRAVRGLRLHSREHAHTARVVGVPTDRPDVFVVAADRPAAYCVVGRPHAIVVTSAAVETLDEAQLAAVLAHEDAHLSGHHHHLLMVLRALASSLPLLPLFTRGAAQVADLLEMCADDSAARRHGTRPLIAGMIMLAGSASSPVAGMAVAANAVIARVTRLMDPAQRGTRWAHRLLVSATISAIVTAPVVVNMLCHH
ncbi:M56 family metallopeptidase [Mycolicibacterium gadium]|jgi:Zn-dependent protease with chaperone function|uniref:M56 family metallopeptidase n=1 Tax=Mycolicibacterium gadium TaxID=1794 RepID=UPI002FDD0CFB